MRIDIEQLEQGQRSFEYTHNPGDFNLEEEKLRLASALRVSGEVRRRREEVIVKGAVNGKIEANCDRCLRPVPVPIDVGFDAHLVPAHVYHENETVELQAEDLDYSVFDGRTVDIDELVREQLLLSLPVRLLCQEDCRGLCAQCGADLNSQSCDCAGETNDPRWDALAHLKKQ